jgi:phosphoribosyl-ATP pyrophosphohydrolase/phosphoribosyl-AMP cyclohydrolase
MKPNFDKSNGLIPVVIQDACTMQVLMLGYMNEEAFEKTQESKLVTFYSRSRQMLWVKGESSGNFLNVVDIYIDCDKDTILVLANPVGPTCHTGATSCFAVETSKGYLYRLQDTINQRIDNNISDSYTNKLFNKGINKIAQKVGEEAVELVIESKDDNIDLFKNEAADLLYHFMILLKAKKIQIEDIEEVLKARSA